MGSDEGKDEVEKILPDEDGKIPADEKGEYPEVIPWSKYVGVKESLGKKLDAEKEKVVSLEEKLKVAISGEAHQKVVKELEEANVKVQTTSDELKTIKDGRLTEVRDILKNKGVSEEDLKDMSEKELSTLAKVIGSYKPKADLGSGGGSGELKGSPMELARQAYEK